VLRKLLLQTIFEVLLAFSQHVGPFPLPCIIPPTCPSSPSSPHNYWTLRSTCCR